MLDYLQNNHPVIGNEYTPIAYTATTLALASHTHPIQALQYVFSNEEYLESASDIDTSLDTTERIIADYGLPSYGTIGDLSEDENLIGYLETLATAIGNALDSSTLSLDEVNRRFEERQIWETISCVGKSWVANGIEWSANTILDKIL